MKEEASKGRTLKNMGKIRQSRTIFLTLQSELKAF